MFLNPTKIVEKFDVLPGMKVANFGIGAGYFTIEMAKRVGNDGVVYAFDVQKEVLEALRGTVAHSQLQNVEIRRADLELDKGTNLANEIVDMVLMSSIFYQLDDEDAVAREAHRILKSGGKAIVIDWVISDVASMGPPKQLRVSKNDMIDIFKNAGFDAGREFDAGEYHYGLIFKKESKT